MVFDSNFFCSVSMKNKNKIKADDEPSAFPDQVLGLYFGWAKLSMNGIFKVLVGVGRGHPACTAKRKIVSI